jgi:hypothetical protein
MRFLRRSAAVMAAVSVAGGLLAACPGVASATQANQAWAGTQNSNGVWNYLGDPSGGGGFTGEIRNFNAGSGMCLDVPGTNFLTYGIFPDGDQVQLWGCNGGDNQKWQQQNNGDGSWTYKAYYSADWGVPIPYCLDSLGGHHYDGSPVEVYVCSGSNAQKWTIGPGGELQSVDSPGFCADATDWGTTDGTQIQLWQCT